MNSSVLAKCILRRQNQPLIYLQTMENDQKNYQTLLQIGRETHHLKGISNLLDWDKETYMPPGASLVRAEQIELMASLIHKAI
jgi:Zn-dependent M32 family carboxypeptidase